MTKYTIDMEVDLLSLISDLDANLNKTEVKGESVNYLFTARLILKTIVENIKREEEKKEDKNGK